MRATGRPMSWAASSLPPMANTACPNPVRLSRTSPTRNAATATTTGMPRPSSVALAELGSPASSGMR